MHCASTEWPKPRTCVMRNAGIALPSQIDVRPPPPPSARRAQLLAPTLRFDQPHAAADRDCLLMTPVFVGHHPHTHRSANAPYLYTPQVAESDPAAPGTPSHGSCRHPRKPQPQTRPPSHHHILYMRLLPRCPSPAPACPPSAALAPAQPLDPSSTNSSTTRVATSVKAPRPGQSRSYQQPAALHPRPCPSPTRRPPPPPSLRCDA